MAISAKSTQEFVPIKEIRDGIVVLKDDSLRAILLASSVNLALKSEDEQRAILMQFQNFLNSLDFPVQIVVQSRRYDIRPYLLTLEKREKEQNEPLLKIQTREYIQFIRTFTETHDIMTKNFFVVIPYSGGGAGPGGMSNPFSGLSGKSSESKLSAQERFEEKRTQVEQRASVVSQGLSRVGVRTTQLGTEEIVEIFYRVFNPGESSGGVKIG
ncbi:MAG: hypothetical protein A2915_04825 [Candidatus Yanofskybacteria bacterium RIFCSPLOWO2_01_FULL_41_34]|uniref:TraC-like domain-containing protein n=1 Tax=Candidatus Nomurabacteria bacterium RIFCSPHIGHO2_02_FULL_42_24 TaxID=1801757 RepID=A0A1F6WIS5_9BACT|nr:MAG: hypothetical protein UV08_C0015G0003 [Parcubacteria group bacterium GW2011_GWA2_42_18]OGI81754.1 MAG: hypothetical protein A3B93_00540 [Candidatus Nomurabacteria bacterium RIFCSPHIGHO2_02_FULL_42_24]OGN21351.1 MAG: hypothetical protein A2915_04825 [Candidatus Yanofskybacteria bacterium RIFCSPLOWO2_01_FULL_41_34]